jgi:hypothetical protein
MISEDGGAVGAGVKEEEVTTKGMREVNAL